MSTTSLDEILGKVKAPAGAKPAPAATKTASAAPAPTGVDAALDRVLDGVGTAKTAGEQPDPVAATQKLAADMAQRAHTMRLKQAHDEGRALGAGFIAELNDHVQAARQAGGGTKVAAEGDDLVGQAAQVMKFAAEDPEGFVRWAYEQQKIAGYNDGIADVHKLAAEHFAIGYDAACAALDGAAK